MASDVTTVVDPLRSPHLVAREDRGTLGISGPDRITWLNGVLTCDVGKLAAGVGCWGLTLSKPGKVLGDVVLVAANDVVRLSVPRERVQALHEWFERFLIMEDAEIADESGLWTWFELHGPGANEAAGRLASELGGAAGTVDFTTGMQASVLILPRSVLRQSVEDTGRRLGVTPMSPEQWQTFRVARFVPLYGVDFDERQNPHEASLERRAVSWDKGCYLGQEAVCMQDMRGKVKRRLVPLLVQGTAVSPGEEVRADSEPVGSVKSVAPLDSGHSLAIALVNARYSDAGTQLSIGSVAAEVVPRPSVS